MPQRERHRDRPAERLGEHDRRAVARLLANVGRCGIGEFFVGLRPILRIRFADHPIPLEQVVLPMQQPPGAATMRSRAGNLSNPKTKRRRRTACVSLLALLVVLVSSTIGSAQTADDDYRFAKKLYKMGRWQLATEAFQKFLKKHGNDPKVPFARLYVGIGLENLNKYREAREVLRGFVKDYPKNANTNDARYRVAECSFYLNELKTAEREFEAFLAAAPKHDFAEFALPYLADAQLRMNKPKEAAANFRKSLARFGKGRMAGVSQLGLARSLLKLKQHDDAIAAFKALAARTSETLAPNAQSELAALYFDLGRYPESAKAFDAIATRFQDKAALIPRARLDAGFAYYRNQDFKTATARFQAAAADKKLASQANYWLGMSHKAMAEYAKAIEVLKAEYDRDPKSKLAPDVLYGLAGSERLAGQHADAHKRYLEFVKNWPKEAHADDSLHYAAETAYAAGKLDLAQTTIDRFKQEYPKSPLWPEQWILQGRVFAARRDEANLKLAVAQFNKVVAESRNVDTQSLARFYLAQAYRRQNDHKRALETLAPLVKRVKKDGTKSRFFNALILAGRSELELKNHQNAVDVMTDYLKLKPGGEHAAIALTTRLTASARLGKKQSVRDDLALLIKNHKDDPRLSAALHEIAEAAYAKKDWDWSIELFTRLEPLVKETPIHAQVLSGLAWSQFEKQDFTKAATTFARLVKEHPKEPVLAPQAAYKYAESLAKNNKIAESADAYAKAFQQFAPAGKAAAGSDKKGGPQYYTFRAGLAAARTWAKLKKTKQADAAYETLLAKFPKPEALDRRLDEWALLNYNAGDYKRSDEIFRRLVREVPESSLADNARYSLAESDLNAGKLDAARKEFAALHADAKSDALVREVSLYRLIGIGTEQGRWKEVRDLSDLFQKSFKKSAHLDHAAFSAAEARVRLNELQKARAALLPLQKRTDASPTTKAEWYPRVWILLAEIAFRGREYDEVARTVAAMHKRFPKSDQLYLADEVLGRSYKKQALFDKAREAFGKVVAHPVGKLTETAAKSQFMIAETYLMQDNHKNARSAYLRVVTLYDFPEWQAPSLFMAGQCDEALKDWDGAVKSYQQLIKQFEKSPYASKARPRLEAVRKRTKVADKSTTPK
eukprot:g12547.t1